MYVLLVIIEPVPTLTRRTPTRAHEHDLSGPLRAQLLRLLREDNLLCLRRRAFVRTTDSNHSLTVYHNLARGLVLSNINQLWVADITYIRLRREFVYLAVVLDAYSSRCLGWALASHRY